MFKSFYKTFISYIKSHIQWSFCFPAVFFSFWNIFNNPLLKIHFMSSCPVLFSNRVYVVVMPTNKMYHIIKDVRTYFVIRCIATPIRSLFRQLSIATIQCSTVCCMTPVPFFSRNSMFDWSFYDTSPTLYPQFNVRLFILWHQFHSLPASQWRTVHFMTPFYDLLPYTHPI